MCASAVELLLSMCSSSCVPGGGSNSELTMHCLHHCQGNTMVKCVEGNHSPVFLASYHSNTHSLDHLYRSSIHPDSYSCHFFPRAFLSHSSISSSFSSEPLHASPVCSVPPPSLSPAQATLDMLLFSQPSPTGDYHYSGNLSPLALHLTLGFSK